MFGGSPSWVGESPHLLAGSEKALCHLAAANLFSLSSATPALLTHRGTHTTLVHTQPPPRPYVHTSHIFCDLTTPDRTTVSVSTFSRLFSLPSLPRCLLPFLSPLCNSPLSCVRRKSPKQNDQSGKFSFYNTKESLRPSLISGARPKPQTPSDKLTPSPMAPQLPLPTPLRFAVLNTGSRASV